MSGMKLGEQISYSPPEQKVSERGEVYLWLSKGLRLLGLHVTK